MEFEKAENTDISGRIEKKILHSLSS
jgi:hypothetical protein